MERSGGSPSHVSAEDRVSNEKIKLIRKLRWIGLEAEARRLQLTLGEAAARTDSVIAEPRETD
jgi:hypothetical protein